MKFTTYFFLAALLGATEGISLWKDGKDDEMTEAERATFTPLYTAAFAKFGAMDEGIRGKMMEAYMKR